MKPFALLVVAPLLTGCGAQDCLLDVAHRDCPPVAVQAGTFPEDDASCRSYGLRPGTRDYAKCRAQKSHVEALTRHESDYGFLRNPVLPDLR